MTNTNVTRDKLYHHVISRRRQEEDLKLELGKIFRSKAFFVIRKTWLTDIERR